MIRRDAVGGACPDQARAPVRSRIRVGLRYDFRSLSDHGRSERYRAALDQCAWADSLGFDYVRLNEHHGADDGYLPSPLVVAAAVGARTESLTIRTSLVILPLHDPLRIAEDAAVADLVCGGRLELAVGAGYVPSEFEMFGRSRDARVTRLEDGVAVLRRAWTGESFTYAGRTVRVTPRPTNGSIPIYLGGTTKLAPIQISVKGFPVVITPTLRWFVQGTVNTTQFATTDVSQAFSVSASLTDNGGKYTTHGSASVSRTANNATPAFTPSSNKVSVTMGPVVTMGLFGHSGPTIRVGLGSALTTSANSAPWWTDDATQQATGNASTPDLTISSATKTLVSHVKVAGQGPSPKTGLSEYQTYGTQQGAVRGPGGRIWLIALMPPQFEGAPPGSQALDAVSPRTGAVNYYAPLPPYVGSKTTLLAYDNGAPAFDGSGNAWMIATATTFSGGQSHYLVRYTPGPSTSRIIKLPSSCSSPHGISSAGNGVVWLSCNSAKAIRVTASGALRTFSLSHVASVGGFAAGASGSVWAVGYNGSHSPIGLVRLTSSGGESYYATSAARGVAGDGSGRVIETAACGSSICFESVSTGGRLSHVATAPGRVSASYGPSMDASGNVWVLVRGTAAKTGQYFLKLTSGNKAQVYSFSLPGCDGGLLSIGGSTAGSADGSAWAESVTSCTFIGHTSSAYVGGLLRFKP